MTPEALFTVALQLEAGWKVTECRILEARVPRSNCPEHGVLSVAVPWAREGSGFTVLFEALAMLLCREMSQQFTL